MIIASLKMIIHNVNAESTLLLEFIAMPHPRSFRYFQSREPSCVDNHYKTWIGTMEGTPMAYAHIDKDDGINWVGICILDPYQRQGLGTQLFDELMKHGKDMDLQLTVDADNLGAVKFYQRFGFKIDRLESSYFLMKYSPNPLLRVSLGEAVDKYSILDIKSSKISDTGKLKYVNAEKRDLQEQVDTNTLLYRILKLINLRIWEDQDLFRAGKGDKQKLVERIIFDNDRRYRVKKKINEKSHGFQEQKGYPEQTCVVRTDGTQKALIRYLSTVYDLMILLGSSCITDDQSVVFKESLERDDMLIEERYNLPADAQKVIDKFGITEKELTVYEDL